MKDVAVIKLEVGSLSANCYVVSLEGQSEAVVIDPGAEPRRIRSALEERGLSLKAIFLTHGHVDHIGAVDELKKWSGASVVIHTDDAAMLFRPELNLSTWMGEPEITAPDADSVLNGDEELVIAGLGVKVIHTPGHTPGSVCYLLEQILFSGDTLFAGSIGRVDFPGSSRDKMSQSLAKLVELSGDTVVYPGHGPMTTIENELDINPFLQGGW